MSSVTETEQGHLGKAPGDGALEAAVVFQEKGNWKASLQLLQPLSSDGQTDIEVFYHLGLAYEKTGQNQKALDTYMRALVMSPYLAHGHYRLAKIQAMLGHTTEAENSFQAALRIGGAGLHKFIKGYASFLASHGRTKEAIQYYLKSIVAAPEYATQVLSLLLSCLEKGGEFGMSGRSDLLASGFDPADLIVLVATFQIFAESLDRSKKSAHALVFYRMTAALDPDDPRWHQLVGQTCVKLRLFSDASDAFGRSIGLSTNPTARQFADLAQIYRRQRKWWQEADALERALELDDARHELWADLGDARDSLNQYNTAADAFARSLVFSPNDAKLHYRLGYVLEKSGQFDQAQLEFERAIALEPSSQFFGIGWFHEQRELWGPTVDAYKTRLAQIPRTALMVSPSGSRLYYKLGFAQERIMHWRDAADSYQAAIAMGYAAASIHYRLGFVWERLGDWGNAAQAYSAAVRTSDKHEANWYYRLGYVLHAQGRFPEAAEAWKNVYADQALDLSRLSYEGGSLATDETGALEIKEENYLNSILSQRLEWLKKAVAESPREARLWYLFGAAHEAEGRWNDAAAAYDNAVRRTSDYQPRWYYRLGYCLLAAGQHEAACAAFAETRIKRRPHRDRTKPADTPADLLAVMHYNEYREVLPIEPKTVLYESNLALTMSCNPFAIFKGLLADPKYADWTHVWALKDTSRLPKQFEGLPNLIVVRHGSIPYLRYLATAGHLINNSTFPSYLIRRDGQKYLNTWHGTPLKALGKDIAGPKFMAHANTARNFLQTTHMLSPNAHTSFVLVDRYDIAHTFTGKLAETGYPRLDQMINASEASKASLRERLGLKAGLPVVLYSPTWRGEMGDVAVDTARLQEDLATMASHKCQVLFRGHHYAEAALRHSALPAKIVPADIDTYELLSIVDVLITDYSSIYFDFLVMNRPIIHYNYDYAEYASSRGLLYFGMDQMPGTVCFDRESMTAALERDLTTAFEPSEAFKKARELFGAHDDGHATQRAMNFFFEDSMDSVVARQPDGKQSLLFYVGHFNPNGITTSAVNLMRALDPEKYRITVAIEPGSIEGRPAYIEKFLQVPQSVSVLGRVGRMVVSPDERLLIEEFNTVNDFPTPEGWKTYFETFAREYRRQFGVGKWDARIDFDGYSRFWGSVFSSQTGPGSTSAIYMHNDMLSEFKTKFSYLESVFRLYSHFNRVVSVSDDMCEVNKRNLAESYGIPEKAFTACPNVINGEAISDLASQPLDADLEAWAGEQVLFVNIGRMSPEKDHAKLIRAFASVHARHPKTRLAILGDGTLRPMLDQLIVELQLQRAVNLAGQRANPFPLLRRADCFVMSSNHEGQPMTLLEAMALGRPIVATDIDGNRGVLKNEYGQLVENSEQGLIDGMELFLAGNVTGKDFDYEAYKTKALNSFATAVLN